MSMLMNITTVAMIGILFLPGCGAANFEMLS